MEFHQESMCKPSTRKLPSSREVPGTHGHQNVGRLLRSVRRGERIDLRNRFLSIDMDAKDGNDSASISEQPWVDFPTGGQFVSGLLDTYRRSGCSYPVFANLRNGLWYGREWDGVCYFKSTDGHSRRWSFSYTRLNIHLAAAAAASGGCFLVDSTRNGKSFPDSFTATVPIWCCILNHLAMPDHKPKSQGAPSDCGDESALGPLVEAQENWDTALHVPRWLSTSEASQIEERVAGWLDGLGDARQLLSTRLRSFLRKPLRPVWLSPGTRLIEGMLPAWSSTTELSFIPVLCVSASRVITPKCQREQHSWVYIQGAGDDEEHWSKGITPRVFWEHANRLITLATGGDRDEFDNAVQMILPAKAKHATSAVSGQDREGLHIPHIATGPSPDSDSPLRGAYRMGCGKSSSEKAMQAAENAWRPAGQEVHAELGSTGLMVSSLAFAARNWSSLGDDCSLLNLSDQPCPEAVVRHLTGRGRHYLHIRLKEGKRANPPKYWQRVVFPSALTFIAATVGGVKSRSQTNLTSTMPFEGPSSGDDSVLFASTLTGGGPQNPVNSGGQSRQNLKDDPSDCRDKDESISITPSSQGRSVHGKSDLEAVCPHPAISSSQKETSQQYHCKQHPQQGYCEPLQQPSTSSHDRSYGRCLVACPTGAEASIIVCLSALLSFFPQDWTEINRDAHGNLSDQRHVDATAEPGGAQCLELPESQLCVRAHPHDSAGCPRRLPAAGTSEGSQIKLRTGSPSKSLAQTVRSTAAGKSSPCLTSSVETPQGPHHHDMSLPSVTVHGQEGRRCPSSRKASRRCQLLRRGFVILEEGVQISKSDVRWRFLLLQQDCPWARPPRRLTQELNEYFITPGEHSWATLRTVLLASLKETETK